MDIGCSAIYILVCERKILQQLQCRNLSLFWNVTQRGLIVVYGRFGTAFRFFFQGTTAGILKMVQRSCPKITGNYQNTPRKVMEEWRPQYKATEVWNLACNFFICWFNWSSSKYCRQGPPDTCQICVSYTTFVPRNPILLVTATRNLEFTSICLI
jgi:hypothetical protein